METYARLVGVLSGVVTICTVIAFIWKGFRWLDRLQDMEMKDAEDIRLLRKDLVSSREEVERKGKADVERLQDEIRSVKDEAVILVEGVSSCLDGLHQLGANHSVTETKDKLDEYINVAAHR